MTPRRQFSRFLLVGLVSTAGHYAVLWLGVAHFGLRASLASALGYMVGFAINYPLNYRYSFDSQRPHGDALRRFSAVVLFGLALNTVLMWLLAEQWHWHTLLAQVLTTGIGLVVNFCAHRWLTFSAPRSHSSL